MPHHCLQFSNYYMLLRNATQHKSFSWGKDNQKHMAGQSNLQDIFQIMSFLKEKLYLTMFQNVLEYKYRTSLTSDGVMSWTSPSQI